jgi:hypothetical protein
MFGISYMRFLACISVKPVALQVAVELDFQVGRVYRSNLLCVSLKHVVRLQ